MFGRRRTKLKAEVSEKNDIFEVIQISSLEYEGRESFVKFA